MKRFPMARIPFRLVSDLAIGGLCIDRVARCRSEREPGILPRFPENRR
jgi:hypothetical protein